MAAIAWSECCNPPATLSPEECKEYRLKRTAECESYCNTVAAWEAFVLDARIGMRVQSGLETLSWFKAKMAKE